MSERWKIQLRNGVFYAIFYIILQLVFSAFTDSKKEEIGELIMTSDFYFKWLIWFLLGMFVIGYFQWKFPLGQRKLDSQLEKEDDSENKWNYIINGVALFFTLGIVLNLDKLFMSISVGEVIFKIIFLSFCGIIFGYINWKNKDGKYDSWSYLFKNIKNIFKRTQKEISE